MFFIGFSKVFGGFIMFLSLTFFMRFSKAFRVNPEETLKPNKKNERLLLSCSL